MWDDLRRIFFKRDQNLAAKTAPLNFRDLPHVEGRYTMHIAGEQFDGRQSTIKSLSVGQRLLLEREPRNPYDSNAVAVRTLATSGGGMVGYLSRDNAGWVSRLLDEGVGLSASVACVFFGDGVGNGLEVQIHVDGVPPYE